MMLFVARISRPLALFLMIAGAATVSVRADEPRPEDAVLVGEASENPERAVDEASREEVATTEADATIAEVEKVSTEADEAFIDAVDRMTCAAGAGTPAAEPAAAASEVD